MSEAVSLLDRIQGLVERETFSLPVFNQAALSLRTLASQDHGMREVEAAIVRDQALAAEVLRVANSAFFRGLSEVSTIRTAIMRIGLQQVIKIVSMVAERAKYEARHPVLVPLMRGLYLRTSGSTLAADWLANRLGHQDTEEVFLAGLLHDIGELVLLRALDEFGTSAEPKFPLSLELVQEILTSAHARVGSNYLKKRHIPDVYCRIALDHHQETCAPDDRLMAMVRLADLAARKVGAGVPADPSLVLVTTTEAAILGLDEVALAELEITLEDLILPQKSGGVTSPGGQQRATSATAPQRS